MLNKIKILSLILLFSCISKKKSQSQVVNDTLNGKIDKLDSKGVNDTITEDFNTKVVELDKQVKELEKKITDLQLHNDTKLDNLQTKQREELQTKQREELQTKQREELQTKQRDQEDELRSKLAESENKIQRALTENYNKVTHILREELQTKQRDQEDELRSKLAESENKIQRTLTESYNKVTHILDEIEEFENIPNDFDIEKMRNILILAIYRDKTVLAKRLIKKLPNIEFVNEDGDSPIIVAAYRNNNEIIKELLERNANSSLQNKYKKSAADYAYASGHRTRGLSLGAKNLTNEKINQTHEKELLINKIFSENFESSQDIPSFCYFHRNQDPEQIANFILENCKEKQIFDLRGIHFKNITFLEKLKKIEYLNLNGSKIEPKNVPLSITSKAWLLINDTDVIKVSDENHLNQNLFSQKFSTIPLTKELRSDVPIGWSLVGKENDLNSVFHLGSGGQGSAYIVRDNASTDFYALKIYKKNLDFEKLLTEDQTISNNYFRLFKNPYFSKVINDTAIKTLVLGRTFSQWMSNGELLAGSSNANMAVDRLIDFLKPYFIQKMFNADGHARNMSYDPNGGSWIMVDCDQLVALSDVSALEKFIYHKMSELIYFKGGMSKDLQEYFHRHLARIIQYAK